MKSYTSSIFKKECTFKIFQLVNGKWGTEIFFDRDCLVIYGGLSTEVDAKILAEAFVHGYNISNNKEK